MPKTAELIWDELCSCLGEYMTRLATPNQGEDGEGEQGEDEDFEYTDATKLEIYRIFRQVREHLEAYSAAVGLDLGIAYQSLHAWNDILSAALADIAGVHLIAVPTVARLKEALAFFEEEARAMKFGELVLGSTIGECLTADARTILATDAMDLQGDLDFTEACEMGKGMVKKTTHGDKQYSEAKLSDAGLQTTMMNQVQDAWDLADSAAGQWSVARRSEQDSAFIELVRDLVAAMNCVLGCGAYVISEELDAFSKVAAGHFAPWDGSSPAPEEVSTAAAKVSAQSVPFDFKFALQVAETIDTKAPHIAAWAESSPAVAQAVTDMNAAIVRMKAVANALALQWALAKQLARVIKTLAVLKADAADGVEPFSFDRLWKHEKEAKKNLVGAGIFGDCMNLKLATQRASGCVDSITLVEDVLVARTVNNSGTDEAGVVVVKTVVQQTTVESLAHTMKDMTSTVETLTKGLVQDALPIAGERLKSMLFALEHGRRVTTLPEPARVQNLQDVLIASDVAASCVLEIQAKLDAALEKNLQLALECCEAPQVAELYKTLILCSGTANVVLTPFLQPGQTTGLSTAIALGLLDGYIKFQAFVASLLWLMKLGKESLFKVEAEGDLGEASTPIVKNKKMNQSPLTQKFTISGSVIEALRVCEVRRTAADQHLSQLVHQFETVSEPLLRLLWSPGSLQDLFLGSVLVHDATKKALCVQGGEELLKRATEVSQIDIKYSHIITDKKYHPTVAKGAQLLLNANRPVLPKAKTQLWTTIESFSTFATECGIEEKALEKMEGVAYASQVWKTIAKTVSVMAAASIIEEYGKNEAGKKAAKDMIADKSVMEILPESLVPKLQALKDWAPKK